MVKYLTILSMHQGMTLVVGMDENVAYGQVLQRSIIVTVIAVIAMVLIAVLRLRKTKAIGEH